MILPPYVKPYPSFFKHLHIFSEKGFNFRKTIFLNKKIYEDLKKDKPSDVNIAILMHEEIHLKRIKNKGVNSWGFKYLFSPKFRLNEELLAYEVMFRFLKSKGLSYDLERVARAMSGHRYLWVKSYGEAKKLLEDLWKSA